MSLIPLCFCIHVLNSSVLSILASLSNSHTQACSLCFINQPTKLEPEAILFKSIQITPIR